jgi:hypothetical protein
MDDCIQDNHEWVEKVVDKPQQFLDLMDFPTYYFSPHDAQLQTVNVKRAKKLF